MRVFHLASFVGGLALHAALAIPAAAQALPAMDTEIDCLDGLQMDVAGVLDGAASPDDKRVFFAQGLRRMSVQVDTRERQYFEEDDATVPGVDYNSRLLAVELDEANNFLFSLTDRIKFETELGAASIEPVLTVDDVQFPSDPTRISSLTLPGYPTHDIRLLAPDDPSVKKLVMITNGGTELLSLLSIYDYSSFPMTLVGCEVASRGVENMIRRRAGISWT